MPGIFSLVIFASFMYHVRAAGGGWVMAFFVAVLAQLTCFAIVIGLFQWFVHSYWPNGF